MITANQRNKTLVKMDSHDFSLRQDNIRIGYEFDFSCFRLKNLYYLLSNGVEKLIAWEKIEYVLSKDSNDFQGRIKTLHYLTDIEGEIDLLWQEQNPNDNNPPENVIGSETNFVVCAIDNPVYESMTDGEIGNLLQQVRLQMIQVLMLTVKHPAIRDMVIKIIKWYKVDYDLFLQLGSESMLDEMQNDIDNNVVERTAVLLFKPFESLDGHPSQHKTIYDNIKSRFNAYSQYVLDNTPI